MKNERKFYRCTVCGNIVGLIESGGGTLVCCGKEMAHLTPNTTDAAQEKHVPLAKRENGTLTVDVGSAPHPMTEEHHISWICAVQGDTTHRKTLDKTGCPCTQLHVGDEPLTVYAFCNLHGLWSAEVE